MDGRLPLTYECSSVLQIFAGLYRSDHRSSLALVANCGQFSLSRGGPRKSADRAHGTNPSTKYPQHLTTTCQPDSEKMTVGLMYTFKVTLNSNYRNKRKAQHCPSRSEESRSLTPSHIHRLSADLTACLLVLLNKSPTAGLRSQLSDPLLTTTPPVIAPIISVVKPLPNPPPTVPPPTMPRTKPSPAAPPRPPPNTTGDDPAEFPPLLADPSRRRRRCQVDRI